MKTSTVDELLVELGEQLRNERVRQRMEQAALAAHAGVARTAVSRLERGMGGQLHTLLAVLRALGKADWLKSLSPPVGIDPMQLLRSQRRSPRRVRARKDEIEN
jgi:transcriptional regulator with XRE-family HTH domain